MQPERYSLCGMIFLCLWFFSLAAFAAPFCIETEGAPDECWFYDVKLCRKEAERRGGTCTANPDEVSGSEYGAPFCLMEAGMIPVCAFQNSENCHQEAARKNTVCYENTKGDEGDPQMLDHPLDPPLVQ